MSQGKQSTQPTGTVRLQYYGFEGRIKEIQYRLSEVLKSWIADWAKVLGDINLTIEVSWEKDLRMNGHYATVWVNNWKVSLYVDEVLFDHINKDPQYIEYIGQNVLRLAQTGVVMRFLEHTYDNTKDTYDLGEIWRKDISKLVKLATFKKVPSIGSKIDRYDLLNLVLHDVPVPVTVTIKEVMDEPKVLLARLGLMKP